MLLQLPRRDRPATSEVLAHSLSTHPVVVRRVLAGLREAGYVRSVKGHGGGWSLACDLADVTLRDVYVALGSPPLFALGHRADGQGCLVEAAVTAALDASLAEAEARLLARLGEVTLAQLADDVETRALVRGARHHDAAPHTPTPRAKKEA